MEYILLGLSLVLILGGAFLIHPGLSAIILGAATFMAAREVRSSKV